MTRPGIIALLAARRRRRARVADAGMTLIEIMIVLAIIGMVMGGVGFGAFNYYRKSQVKTARIAANKVAQATQQFMIDNNNNCPTALDDVIAQKFLQAKDKKDPWNRDYLMRCPGQQNTDGVDIVSLGPDGQEGTADDIKSDAQ